MRFAFILKKKQNNKAQIFLQTKTIQKTKIFLKDPIKEKKISQVFPIHFNDKIGKI